MYTKIHCSNVSHNYNWVWNVDLYDALPIDDIALHLPML